MLPLPAGDPPFFNPPSLPLLSGWWLPCSGREPTPTWSCRKEWPPCTWLPAWSRRTGYVASASSSSTGETPTSGTGGGFFSPCGHRKRRRWGERTLDISAPEGFELSQSQDGSGPGHPEECSLAAESISRKEERNRNRRGEKTGRGRKESRGGGEGRGKRGREALLLSQEKRWAPKTWKTEERR